MTRTKTPVKSYKTIYCDVDETLILWDLSAHRDRSTYAINYLGKSVYVVPHDKNLNLLTKFYKMGYSIVVWSHTGWDWAEEVCKTLAIDYMVSLYLSKPRYYLDDLPSQQWMGERLWRDLVTGNSEEVIDKETK